MSIIPLGVRSDPDWQSDTASGRPREEIGSGLAAQPEAPPQALVRRAARVKAKPPEAEPAVPAVKKPFKMSYDGTTEKDYIAHIIRLGAR